MNDRCPDCGVPPDSSHDDGCDVARCLATGAQRIQCGGELHTFKGSTYGEHEGSCGRDVWTGEWPGEDDCRRLGFWCTDPARPPMVPCTPDTRGAVPDLNRLSPVECRWDQTTHRWELR